MRVSHKGYILGKSMAEVVKSSPYLSQKQKDEMIGEIIARME